MWVERGVERKRGERKNTYLFTMHTWIIYERLGKYTRCTSKIFFHGKIKSSSMLCAILSLLKNFERYYRAKLFILQDYLLLKKIISYSSQTIVMKEQWTLVINLWVPERKFVEINSALIKSSSYEIIFIKIDLQFRPRQLQISWN